MNTKIFILSLISFILGVLHKNGFIDLIDFERLDKQIDLELKAIRNGK